MENTMSGRSGARLGRVGGHLIGSSRGIQMDPASGILAWLRAVMGGGGERTTHKPGSLRLPQIFGPKMVLQQGKPVCIWGWGATEGGTVQVTLGTSCVSSTTADSDGKWSLYLPPQAACMTGQTLAARDASTDDVISYDDVLVGECWLCSGQSNMQMAMAASQHFEEEAPKTVHPIIRLYRIDTVVKSTPQSDLPHMWETCSLETVEQFSAVAYHFGERLSKQLDGVPIGLIQSAWGGTEIEPWIPECGFAAVPSLQSYVTEVQSISKLEDDDVTSQTPSAIYNAMIHPLAPFGLRGFLWYQGESNCLKGDTKIYTDKMLALTEGWRSIFKDANLPIYTVQLAPFQYTKTWPDNGLTTESLPEFWEAQTNCLGKIQRCGMVVINDITGDTTDIHPVNKRDVGRRLAGLALANDYAQEVVHAGPSFHSLTIEDVHRTAEGLSLSMSALKLQFKDAHGGLVTCDGEPLRQFSIAGNDGIFTPAEATISEDGVAVVVTSPEVLTPVAVRYAWDETAIGNLSNRAGLPALPFRTYV